MSTCLQISHEEFLLTMKDQGVPREHYAFKCVRCGNIQSAVSLVKYMSADEALARVYFSCEGRFTKERGCDWTLGGLFKIHKLEVLTEDKNDPVCGILRTQPVFEPASPEEALELMRQTLPTMRKCRVCGCDDFHACPGGCSWAEPDLCSTCAGKDVQQ